MALFSPLLVSGCQIWLDGNDTSTIVLDGEIVTQWLDKSANGYNATLVTGTPTYTGTGIVFDGSSYFELPDGSIPYGDASYSIYIVAVWTTYGTSAVIGGGSQGASNAIGIRSEGGEQIRSYWWGNDMTESVNTFNTVLHDYIYQSGGERSTYLYGTNTGTDTPGVRLQPNTGNTIGTDVDRTNMIGTISEVLVYNTSHTIRQRQAIEGYLAWKWSLQSQLPSDHAFYNNPPAPPILNSPTGIVIDNSGNLYVLDTGNNVIRKITQGGQVSIIAGSGQAGNLNGVGINSSFNNPSSIAIDSSGNLLITDKYNSKIRKINIVTLELIVNNLPENKEYVDTYNYSETVVVPKKTVLVSRSSDVASQIGPTLSYMSRLDGR